MGLLNWRSRSPYRIDQVVVPEDTFAEGTSRYMQMTYVQMFVNHALDTAMWARHELPREALIAAHVADYLGEVNNGGHAQFVANTGWDVDMRADIREGLSMLRLDEAARIFADLEAFAVAEPERFRCIGGMGSAALANLMRPGSEPQTIDPYFHELDDRFFGTPSESIADAIGSWLETRPPWLRVVPDAEYNGPIPGWKTPDHPLRDARWRARWRRSGFDLGAFLARLREYLHGG